MGRLTTDNMLEAMEVMSDGNPGAADVCGQLFEKKGLASIDLLRHLDAAEIYGPDIWIAYKDVCNQKIDDLIKLIPQRDVLKASVEGAKRLTGGL